MSAIFASEKRTNPILGLMFIGLLIISSVAHAERATTAEMDNVCRNWVIFSDGINQDRKGIDRQIIDIEDIVVGNLLLGRIYTLSPSGFAVVPALKELAPVMFFSEEVLLGPEQEHGIREIFFDVLSDKFQRFENAYNDINNVLPDRNEHHPGRKLKNLWDRYSIDPKEFISKLEGGAIIERSDPVGPLLTTAWHQYPPYNLACPIGVGGWHTAVGCTATACAQVFYYWQWPKTGVGSHSYYWGGDNTCEEYPPTIAGYVTADFSDPYIYDTEDENLAELNFEVGASLDMDYSICGSTAYIEPAVEIFPRYFKYKPTIALQARDYFASDDEWYYFLKNDIDAGRPMPYRINAHLIVCDGYHETGGIKYVHMNFGLVGELGQAYNTWYAIDEDFCQGCNYHEFVIYNMEPAWVWPTSDTTFGVAPLEINLTTETDFDVDNWIWDFGDGTTIFGDFPATSHTYNTSGMFDLTVNIESEGKTYSATRPDYIIVIADTMAVGMAEGEVGEAIEVPIYGNNTIPLNNIIIPVKYSGAMQLRYDSCSIAGCRTDNFMLIGNSLGSGFLKFDLTAGSTGLEPGNGLLLKVYFTILSGANEQSATISLDNIGSIYTLFKDNSSGLEYNPVTQSGTVTFPGTYGDANNDNLINILDVVYVINFVYKGGPAPQPLYTGNVNGDESINILDIVYLINFIYKEGPPPIEL